MDRPDDSDIRAVLREHGHEPPARGKLGADWLALYAGIHNGQEPDQPAGGYEGGGRTGADFPEEDDTAVEPGPERPPGRVRQAKPSLRDRFTGGKGKGGRKTSGRKHRRVPVDRLCEHGWDFLARMAKPIDPPLSRCLAMQAPVAGLVLEDVVRGTVVDRVLQPVARAEEKGRRVIALVGPPVIVAALEHAQTLPDAQRQVREALLVPMLREAMVTWVEVAGDKIEEKARRDAEYGPVYEQVDQLLAMIFAPPTPGPATSPEDEAAARAQEEAMAGAGAR